MENLSRIHGTSSIFENSILEVPTLVACNVTANCGNANIE
jgi:hypothetical protein